MFRRRYNTSLFVASAGGLLSLVPRHQYVAISEHVCTHVCSYLGHDLWLHLFSGYVPRVKSPGSSVNSTRMPGLLFFTFQKSIVYSIKPRHRIWDVKSEVEFPRERFSYSFIFVALSFRKKTYRSNTIRRINFTPTCI